MLSEQARTFKDVILILDGSYLIVVHLLLVYIIWYAENLSKTTR